MDCTFKTPEGKFNLRVGAVITDGKRVLVSKDGSHSFYWVTGGRVKLGETTEEAILREIREELGVEAEVARLYSIAEKFFTVDGVFYHELEYLYLIKPFDICENRLRSGSLRQPGYKPGVAGYGFRTGYACVSGAPV